MKTLVVFFSNTGSNKYLAEKMAHTLNADIDPIKPRLNFFPFLILFSLLKKSLGMSPLSHKVVEYDRVVVCCPIWMGQLISPLRDFITMYRDKFNSLYFATCCGSADAAKNDKFGHGLVFQQIKNLLNDKTVHCEAFPIGLVLPQEMQKDGEAIMKTRLSDSNFSGEIRKRFEGFVSTVAGI
jgi:flavodoxin